MSHSDDVAVTDRGHYDVLGIGLGPFNLGLAALLDGADTDLDATFLEKESEFSWHDGMLIDGTTLEVPFLADLVTLADPTSEYTYLNYLRELDRIYKFYFYETFLIPRREYDAYMRWVANSLDATRFDREVTSVRERDGTFVVEATHPEQGDRYRYYADDLVLGIGSCPHVPEQFRAHLGDDVFHTARYLDRRERVLEADAVTVVGSGQSAAEVVLDLIERQSDGDYRLDWLTRSRGFFPMEYSKLGLQHFTPEYTSYFYDLPQEKKDEILPDQDLLYKGIDVNTSAAIYDRLYEQSIAERDPPIGMMAMTDVRDVHSVDDEYRLYCEHWQEESSFVHETEVVVLGTGYHRPTPSFLDPLRERIEFDDRGRYRVTEGYRLESDLGGRVFVQNAEVHTHGVGAPDLGLGCYRNATIIEQLVGRAVYPVDEDTVFEDFGVGQFLDRGNETRSPTSPLVED